MKFAVNSCVGCAAQADGSNLNKDSGVLLLAPASSSGSHASAALADGRGCLVSLPKEASAHASWPPEPVRGVANNNGRFSQRWREQEHLNVTQRPKVTAGDPRRQIKKKKRGALLCQQQLALALAPLMQTMSWSWSCCSCARLRSCARCYFWHNQVARLVGLTNQDGVFPLNDSE